MAKGKSPAGAGLPPEVKARIELWEALTALAEKLNDVLDIVIEQERD